MLNSLPTEFEMLCSPQVQAIATQLRQAIAQLPKSELPDVQHVLSEMSQALLPEDLN